MEIKLIHSVANKPVSQLAKGEEYGVTKYKVEQITEFTLIDVLEKRDELLKLHNEHNKKFAELLDYIESLLIETDMTDEEYAAVVARRTDAEKQRIEEKIRNGGR